MPKLFAICRMAGGNPDIDLQTTPLTGWVHMDSIGNFGAYLFSGTAAQLTTINALPNVIGLVAVTEVGDVKWAELDGVIAAGVRTKLNTWLSARGYPNIPSGWTYRQVVEAVYKRMNDKFDFAGFDITE